MHVVSVTTRQRTYNVHVEAHALSALGAHARELCPIPTQRALVVVDEGVPASLLSRATESLGSESIEPIVHTIAPTEHTKSFASLESILITMSRARLERGDPVIALGGGITGDIAGLAAAMHHRGTPVIQCPTTLLAMVDASVGGKTAINLTVDGALYKNMAGAFCQPVAVIADTDALETLSDRAYVSGIAECIKHTMLCASWDCASLISFTDDVIDRVVARDTDILPEFIARNVQVKAAVVAADELEDPHTDPECCALGRAVLNLGHTFAHALESHPELSPDTNSAHAPLTHGEAVALGLVAASAASVALHLAPTDTLAHTRTLVARAHLPTHLATIPPADSLLGAMTHDKKVRAGKLRLVLPCGGGRCTIVDDPSDDVLAAGFYAWKAE